MKRKPTRGAASKKAAVAKKKPTKKAPPAQNKKPAKKKPAKKKPTPAKKKRSAKKSKWVTLVSKYGLMLASAHGPVLNVAHFVADEPIIGGWWAHPKGKAIFAALQELDDSPDIHAFKLFEDKITFAHRKMWPALVRLGREGMIAADILGLVEQQHLPSGDRNVIVPFPEWVDAETAAAADALSLDDARTALPFFE